MRPARLAALATVAALLGSAAPCAHAYVYWAAVGPAGDGSGTTIGRADLDGSGVTHDLIGDASGPAGLAVDGGHIYWANSLHPMTARCTPWRSAAGTSTGAPRSAERSAGRP
jgi:hypothetical protein